MPDSITEQLRKDHSEWPVWKGRLSDLEQDEEDMLPYTTVAERFAAIWQLTQDGYSMSGTLIDESTFPTNSGSLIRREG
jgi:hypothetical protein